MTTAQSAATKPAAVIVPVGIDAVVGDIVVAAVVLTDDVDNKVLLEQVPNGNSLRLVIWNAARNIPLADFSMKTRHNQDEFKYFPEGLVLRADALLGSLFTEYAKLPDFSTVVGFCPKSEDEMRLKLQIVAKRLTKIIRDRYPTSHIQVSPQMFAVSPEEAWRAGRRLFPSVATIVDNDGCLGEGDVLRLMFAHLVAEALATGVRSARCMDYGEIYPALRIEDNLGYGCSNLFRGLEETEGFDVWGLRGSLTDQWLQWSEKIIPRPASARSPVGESPDTHRELCKVYLDDKNRKAIKLSQKNCETIINDLEQGLANNTGSAAKVSPRMRDLFLSIARQFKAKKYLSGRQMYIVWALSNGEMR